MAIDGGHLILSPESKKDLLESFPESLIFIKRIFGAQEFIKGIERWCLWIKDGDLPQALKIPPIEQKINMVKQSRLNSSDKSTHILAKKPHQFREMKIAKKNSIIIPTVTSERREYIPIGFLNQEEVIIAPNNAIYDAEPWVFGIISSRMHMTWVKTTAGRLESRLRYSLALCYNTFPIPNLTEEQKANLEIFVRQILAEREKHTEKTMAQLYDPDKMPDELRKAHHKMDLAVESYYRSKPFDNDEERLEYLFKLYEEMIETEKRGQN